MQNYESPEEGTHRYQRQLATALADYRDSTVNGRDVVAGWIVVALILLVVVVTTGI